MSQGATEPGQEPGQQAPAGQGQEPPANGTQGQEPQGGQQGTEDGQPDLSSVTDPALRAYLEKVAKDAREAREEAARYRTERNTFRDQVTQFQRQNESDQERQAREAQERQERLDRLERENRDLKVNGAVKAAAEKAKAFNPDTVVGLIATRVELDDNGQPKNLDDLLKGLRDSDPYLFKRERTADAGQGNGEGAAPGTDMNDRIRDLARRGRGATT